METILPSQPENYGPLIKRSLILYRASFSKVILLAFLLSIVVFIPRLLSDIMGEDILLNLALFSPYRLWFLLINLVATLFFIAIVWHMFCEIHGVHEPLVEDVVIGIKKVIYVFIATLLQSALFFAAAAASYGLLILLHQYQLLFAENLINFLFTFLLFFGQLLLFLYITTLFIFLVPLIAIENKGIVSSLERSALLVWNHWWRTVSVQITPWLCYLFVLMAIKFIVDIDVRIFFFQQAYHSIWSSLLHLIVFALFIPWVAALLLIQLKDLELRKKIMSSLE